MVVYAVSLPMPRHMRLGILHFVVIVLAHHSALRDHAETGSISSHSITTNVAAGIARSGVFEGTP